MLWSAVFLVLLLGVSCSSQYSAEPPEYLAEAIRERPPGEGLTLYPTNGPWGGVAVNDFAQVGRTVFAATESGLYRSDDEGQTWRLSSPEDRKYGSFSHVVTLGQSVFAGAPGDLYRSDDSGESWKDITPPQSFRRVASFGLATVRDELWASDGRTIWFSKDKGESWQTERALGPGAAPEITGLFVVRDTLFADASRYDMFWRIEGWPPRYTPMRFADSSGIDIVGMASLGGELLAATPEGLYQPAGSEGWRLAKKPPGDRKITSLTVNDKVVLVGTDDGIYRAEELGSDWEFVGVRGEQVHVLSAAGTGLLAGTNTGVYRSDLGGKNWTEASVGLGSIGKLVSGGGARFTLTSTRVFESFDLGDSWEVARTAEPEDYLRDISADGTRLLVASRRRLYLRDTPSSSWRDISPDPSRFLFHAVGTKGDLLLAGPLFGGSDILRSKDGGTSWQAAESPGESRYSRPSTFEAASNGRWLAVWTELPEPGGGVLQSDDQGQTWRDLKSDRLVNRDVRALRLVGDAVFAGTAQGTISSLDLSNPDATWSLQAADPSLGDISALWVDPNTLDEAGAKVLIAGTTNGLYWANDGGDTFQKVETSDLPSPFDRVSSVDYTDGHLMIATNAGVYYAVDRIPRPLPWALWTSIGLVLAFAGLQLAARFALDRQLTAPEISRIPNWVERLATVTWGGRKKFGDALRWHLQFRLGVAFYGFIEEVEPPDFRKLLDSELSDLPDKIAVQVTSAPYRQANRLSTPSKIESHAVDLVEETVADRVREERAKLKEREEKHRREEEAKQHQEEELRQRQLEAEVTLARQTMRSVLQLPEGPFERPGVRLAHRLKQATSISGDFYNIIPRGDGSVGIYLVDVEGHGLVAAQTAQDIHRVLTDPSLNWGTGEARKQLEIADRVVYERLGDRSISVTMCFAEVDPFNHVVRFANAGMPLPLLFRRDEALPEELRAAGVYVGAGYAHHPVKPERAEVTVGEGDLLVLYSDGIIEAEDANGRLFGTQGLVAVVTSALQASPDTIADAVLTAVTKYAGSDEPADDQTLIVVRIGAVEDRLRPATKSFEVLQSDRGLLEIRGVKGKELSHLINDGAFDTAVREWLELGNFDLDEYHRVFAASYEALVNAGNHGTNPGDQIFVQFRRFPDGAVEMEMLQQKEWPEWDRWLGERRRAEHEAGSVPWSGTVGILDNTSSITATSRGRRIKMRFAPPAGVESGKQPE